MIEKYLKLFKEYIPFILQLSLILGIGYQFYSLFNWLYLSFFSWTQVVNDTVVLLLPTTFIVCFFIFGYYLSKQLTNYILTKIYNSNFIQNHIYLFLYIIIFVLLLLIERALGNIKNKTFIDVFRIYLLIFYPISIGILSYYIIKYFLKKGNWIGKGINAFFGISLFLLIGYDLNKTYIFFSETRFKHLYVTFKNQNDFNELKNNDIVGKGINLSGNKVIYLNDKYVFTESLVLNNDNSLIFFKK